MDINTFKLLHTLVERESYWLRQKLELLKSRKVVIFPAGLTAQSFYYTLLSTYGIEAEYFIDNNSELIGKTVCGKSVQIHPWENDPAFTDDYFVLIPTMEKFYSQIISQLSSVGIIAYMHADSYCACQLWDRYVKVIELLNDEQSKISYLGAIYYMLTLDNSFVQYESDEYFSLKQFVYNGFEIIVDAGSFTGDTIEEYLKHGSENVMIYAFEPYNKAFKRLTSRVERLMREWMLRDGDIILINAGVGAETKILNFSTINPSMLRQSNEGNVELQVYSIDDYFKDKEPFSLLKADIEGAEMDMLKGAKQMIQTYKPKMTICIYHSPEDFAQIVEYIHSLVPEYNLAIRSHFYDHRETVLYCWV